MPLLIALALGIIEGSRTSILLGSVLLISTYFGMINVSDQKIKFPFLKIFLILFIFVVLFIGFFIAIQWLRQGLDPLIFELLLIRLKTYLFGYLSAFTLWFGNIENFFSLSFNLTTFAGPF